MLKKYSFILIALGVFLVHGSIYAEEPVTPNKEGPAATPNTPLKKLDTTTKNLPIKPQVQDEFLLDQQFKGPFKDTLIQRWVDKINGNICYLYIPVMAPGLPIPKDAPNPQSLPRIYGSNTIGNISCVGGKK